MAAASGERRRRRDHGGVGRRRRRHGPLGPKDGGVYPIGDGFGQNFAGGRIYFTPDTGAHIMQGAILDKYLSLGGPADGDLGFPTIDEGEARRRQPEHHVQRGRQPRDLLHARHRCPRGAGCHQRRMGQARWLRRGARRPDRRRGVPRRRRRQTFTGGQLSWNRKTEAFTTTPPELADQLVGLVVPGDATSAIAAARRAAGGPIGPAGCPGGTSSTRSVRDGLGQNYAGGKIFYSPATGANVMTGQVLAKYESVGGPAGDLGFPTSNETDGGLAPMSSIVTFAAADQPVIFWTPDFGAVIVRGAMNAAWTKFGGAKGELGAPTADQTENGDVVTQKFNGGAISWNKSTNAFSTEPANLASELSGLEVPGQAAAGSARRPATYRRRWDVLEQGGGCWPSFRWRRC